MSSDSNNVSQGEAGSSSRTTTTHMSRPMNVSLNGNGKSTTTPVAGGSEASLKRPKQQLSCAECRRLKLKCDREVPCSNCVRRHCKQLCPNRTKETRRPGLDAKAAEQLQKRLSTLEGFLADRGLDISDDTHAGTPRHKRKRSSPHAHSPSDDSHSLESEDDPAGPGPGPQRASSPPSPIYDPSPRQDRDRSSSGAHPPPSNTGFQQHQNQQQYHHSHSQSQSHVPLDTYSSSRSPSVPSRPPPMAQLPSIQSFTSAASGGGGGGGPAVEPSHGTLVIGRSGRSRYLGPSAGTEWLKNQEVEGIETPGSVSPSRHAPEPLPQSIPLSKSHSPLFAFPFADPDLHHSEDSLLAQLPAKEDAEVLVDSYYRYFAWNHDIAPRPTFQRVFDQVYLARETERPERKVHAQQIALVYMILALGTVQNLELPPHDESAEEYIALGKACLSKGDFLNHGTIAGVQALMGLHRDGARWNLPEEVVEERRRVFWEAHTIEVFQANCFSRPSSLVSRYIDTAFPSPSAAERASGVKCWTTLQYEICQLAAQTALLALPSVYPDPEMARRESPEVSRRNLHRTLQQFTLALNISENILFLQRPYFVMAMHDQPIDPTRSMYGHSYLAVVERCNVLIQIVAELYRLHPTIIARQWFFWYHLFTAAVCLGTLILKNPQSVLATFALTQIDQAINVFSILIKQNNTPSMVQNHDWLIRLRQRAINKVHQAQAGAGEARSWGSGEQQEEEEEEDRELLGWRTRLIERGATGTSVAVNIHGSNRAPGQNASPMSSRETGGTTGMTPTVDQVLQQHFVPPTRGGQGARPGSGQGAVDNSTDLLLHQFWDPMMMADGGNLASANWWSWDFALPGDDTTAMDSSRSQQPPV
ncbi:hypothetical protein CI109_106336 [Kwoniella shandongensis]|uniref:Zn(2)-C6 fungal-type domain-containing protein n=1 Tax=Kwoniella shandongensis TaxID=1734106 RepID=A0AAJ8MZU7_9TREE